MAPQIVLIVYFLNSFLKSSSQFVNCFTSKSVLTLTNISAVLPNTAGYVLPLTSNIPKSNVYNVKPVLYNVTQYITSQY